MKNNTAGHLAEYMAQWYMRLHGYHILAANVVTGRGTHAGEVDFIAKRGKTLIFAEVKKRSTMERAAYAITPQQQQRIRKGAQAFIKRNPKYQEYNIRFDAILITFPCTIEHIKNAW